MRASNLRYPGVRSSIRTAEERQSTTRHEDVVVRDHVLFTNVEPCCLFLGPQISRRSCTVVGPADEVVEAVTGLLMSCHYFCRRPGRGAAGVAWREERPDLVEAVAQPSVACVISRDVEREAIIDALIDELRPLLGGIGSSAAGSRSTA